MAKDGTKLCKHCKTEIPAGAKVCPNCRKKQGGVLKWIIIAVVVILIIGAVAGGGEDSETKTAESTKSEAKQTAKKKANKKAKKAEAAEVAEEIPEEVSEEAPEEEAEQDNIINVGETFEKAGLRVTITSYNPDYTGYNEYFPPEEGNKYIEVGFTYENVDDSADKYVSIYDCDCYADNVSCEQAYIGGEDFINANISPGRNVSFTTYYQIPVNSQSVELEYEDLSIWSNEKVIIKLQ